MRLKQNAHPIYLLGANDSFFGNVFCYIFKILCAGKVVSHSLGHIRHPFECRIPFVIKPWRMPIVNVVSASEIW